MISRSPPQLMVIIVGDYKNPLQAFLVYKKQILCEISTEDLPVSLLHGSILHFQHVLPKRM